MIVNQKSNYYLRLFFDLLLLNAIFLISAILAQSFQTLLARNFMFILLAILNFLWYFTSNINSFYDDYNLRSLSYQFINILKNTFVQAIAAVIFIFISKEDLFTRNFIFYYSFILVFLISVRVQLIKFLSVKILRGKSVSNLAVVGAGEIGKNFYNSILKKKEKEYNFLGYIDDSIQSEPKNIIGPISNFEQIITSKGINEVVVALPIHEFDKLDNIIKICNRHAVRVHIIPDYFRFVSKKFRISMFENFPIISIRNEPLAELHWRFIKRSFDIIVSSIVIILFLSWLVPLLSILIKIFSGSPVFFVQNRIGRNNKTFRFYKFRTLITDEKEEHETFSPVTAGDKRITKIGSILRQTNLDELPQFFNVIKGDMSIVGPRPHFIPYDVVYSEIVDEIKLRSRVRPGLTGWAQVHGLRGDSTDPNENKIRTEKRIEYDIWYIENWSIWLDIQIIILTVWHMITGETKAV